MVSTTTETEAKGCDRTGVDGVVCSEKATQAYSWDWGETGVCCDTHAVLLQQIAGQIERKLVLTPLTRAPQPIGRDERIALTARSLVLQEEVENAKLRGLELYRINQQLAAELRLYKVRAEEAHVQLTEAQKQAAQLLDEVAERDAENARLLADNERLKLLEASLPDAPAAPTG